MWAVFVFSFSISYLACKADRMGASVCSAAAKEHRFGFCFGFSVEAGDFKSLRDLNSLLRRLYMLLYVFGVPMKMDLKDSILYLSLI